MQRALKYLGVIGFAVLLGYLTFKYMGGGPDNTGRGMISRLVACIVVSSFIGVIVVIYILPKFGEAVAFRIHSNSGEEPEPLSSYEQGMIKMSHGEFDQAMEFFREAVEDDEANRLPWVEMAQITLVQYEDPEAAVDILTEGLEAHEWVVEDASDLMFRIGEIYKEVLGDRDNAVQVYKQIVQIFDGHDDIQTRARQALYGLGVVA